MPADAEEARLLRRLVDNIPAMASYWDRDQRNVIANQAFVDYFGLTPAELHGRHLRDPLGEELYELNRADLDAVLRRTARLRAGVRGPRRADPAHADPRSRGRRR